MLQERLLTLRKEKGLSQEEFAEKMGVSRQAVAKWEAGQSVPDLTNLIQISDCFSVTIDSLVKPQTECGGHVRESAGEENEKELLAFLSRASKATYAGGGPKSETPMRPESRDLYYQEGELTFIDTYLGDHDFAGEEAIWRNGKPIWAMNYCGRVLAEEFTGEFLMEALRAAKEDSPYRGPEFYQKGDYTYHTERQGQMDWFYGREQIFCRDKKVYECMYHGGRLR